jgi:serine/threonine protein kinase
MKFSSFMEPDRQHLQITTPISTLEQSKSDPVQKKEIEIEDDFISILEAFNLKPVLSGYYLQVGFIEKTQGWILHLSVVFRQVKELLNVIIPYLIKENVPFKVPKDMYIVHQLNDGGLGSTSLGKIVSIFPPNDQDALHVAEDLINLTNGFSGPAIPTDRQLEGIVYSRYGSFNPILKRNQQGQSVKYIYDGLGTLVPDSYSIPFQCPNNVRWPFEKIVNLTVRKQGKLMGFKYFPINTLKADSKGHVIKALYFKRFYRIRSCLIKEGKQNMFLDYAGRDIRDRLKWQHDLHRDLYPDIPLPKLIGYFNQNDEHYLVMEFIKGITFGEWLESNYEDNIWQNLPFSTKYKLLKKFLTILIIVGNLHRRGYIHRDLTPGNILIDRHGKLTLIDMELAWNSTLEHPNPPFKLGTPGFMSPEQEATLKPTVKEDIYALGALMITLFTNLPPLKFSLNLNSNLKDNLVFFTGDITIASLIFNCLQQDPDARPNLEALMKGIHQILQNLDTNPSTSCVASLHHTFTSEAITTITQSAINGLSHPIFLNDNRCWLSRKSGEDSYFGNQQVEMALYLGWHTGMSGPLWVLAKAKQFGFIVDDALEAYQNSLDYVKNTFETQGPEIGPGLYTGTAGLARMLGEGLKAGLICANEEYINLLRQCFFSTAPIGGLSNGLAGQGIALLSCADWLEQKAFQELLENYTESLISAQNRNGSWALYNNSGKNEDIFTGLSYGVAGIIWFLLQNLERFSMPHIEQAVIKGLDWLESKSIRENGACYWAISSRAKRNKKLSTSHGGSGIILTFIKAYEVLHLRNYKTIAESWLKSLPEQPMMADFSLSSGLAGLGEIYLEAARVFRDQRWLNRADWISKIFAHTFQSKTRQHCFWITEDLTRFTSDLYTGNSGIVHFMLHSAIKGGICHPLGITPNIK